MLVVALLSFFFGVTFTLLTYKRKIKRLQVQQEQKSIKKLEKSVKHLSVMAKNILNEASKPLPQLPPQHGPINSGTTTAQGPVYLNSGTLLVEPQSSTVYVVEDDSLTANQRSQLEHALALLEKNGNRLKRIRPISDFKPNGKPLMSEFIRSNPSVAMEFPINLLNLN